MYNIEKRTFPQYLNQICDKYEDNIAIIDEEEEFTYGEMKVEVNKVACYFNRIGIRQGDNVIVQLSNSSTEIFIIFALIQLGAIPIMVLPAYGENELEGITGVATPKAFVGMRTYLNSRYQDRIEKLADKYPCIESVVYEDEVREFCHRVQTKDCIAANVMSEDLALLLLSGGTTGIPKLIPRTHMDYIYNAKKAADRCRLSEDDIYLACMPIVHNFTLCAPGVLGTFYSGGSVVISNEVGPIEILENIEEYEITFTSLVPALAKCCCDVLEEDDGWDIESLRMLLIGGAMLERKVAEKVIDCFKTKLVQVFGTAEGLICTTSLDDDMETVLTTQGKPISDLDQVRIVDLEGNDVPTAQQGELITRGPYTIKEYYRLGEKNVTSFTADGFYKTGDKACVTENGNLKILGRIREQINRAGEKIMPSEVEEMLLQLDGIRNCAVVGVRDTLMGMAIVACVICDEDIEINKIKQDLMKKGLAAYKVPDRVIRMKELPLTAFGKVDKKALSEMIVKNGEE